jgi:hypothetical protein
MWSGVHALGCPRGRRPALDIRRPGASQRSGGHDPDERSAWTAFASRARAPKSRPRRCTTSRQVPQQPVRGNRRGVGRDRGGVGVVQPADTIMTCSDVRDVESYVRARNALVARYLCFRSWSPWTTTPSPSSPPTAGGRSAGHGGPAPVRTVRHGADRTEQLYRRSTLRIAVTRLNDTATWRGRSWQSSVAATGSSRVRPWGRLHPLPRTGVSPSRSGRTALRWTPPRDGHSTKTAPR